MPNHGRRARTPILIPPTPQLRAALTAFHAAEAAMLREKAESRAGELARVFSADRPQEACPALRQSIGRREEDSGLSHALREHRREEEDGDA